MILPSFVNDRCFIILELGATILTRCNYFRTGNLISIKVYEVVSKTIMHTIVIMHVYFFIYQNPKPNSSGISKGDKLFVASSANQMKKMDAIMLSFVCCLK